METDHPSTRTVNSGRQLAGSGNRALAIDNSRKRDFFRERVIRNKNEVASRSIGYRILENREKGLKSNRNRYRESYLNQKNHF